MQSHPLDNVIWSALRGSQRALSQGTDLALRFTPEFCPFAAFSDPSRPNYEPLLTLPPSDRLVFFTPHHLEPPPPFEVSMKSEVFQFIAPGPLAAPDPCIEISKLTNTDTKEMRALALETKPGPFLERTHELGQFFGVRVNGLLVAMSGERMRVDGFTEVSGVCTDLMHHALSFACSYTTGTLPTYRGKGYAAALILTVVKAIQARGEVAFLHVFTHNTKAIDLYRRLGFIQRQQSCLTVLTITKSPA